MLHEYLFVIGCPRSGTTALRRLLNSQGEISIGVERYGTRVFGKEFLSPDLFEKERFFSVKSGDTFYDNLIQFNSWYGTAQGQYESARYRGDKIPKLYKRLGELYERFPEPKVIFI